MTLEQLAALMDGLADEAPGLLEVHAVDAILAVVPTDYWGQYYRLDGSAWPTIVVSTTPGLLDLRPFQDGTQGWVNAYATLVAGTGLIVVRPSANGITGLHEAAHLLDWDSGHQEELGHSPDWVTHFEALVEEWQRLQQEPEAA